MATSTLQPSSNANLSQTMDCEDNNTQLRVASFSTYLNPVDEDFVVKLAGSFRKPSFDITLTEEGPRPDPISLGMSKTRAAGIRVFDAERYFNMKIDDESPRSVATSLRKQWHDTNEDQVDPQPVRTKVGLKTASASSEASWNSQSALLPSFMRNPSQTKQRKAAGNRFFNGFACRGSCSDDKSVHVNRNQVARGDGNGKDVTKGVAQLCPNPIMLDKLKQSERGFHGKDEISFQSLEKSSIGFSGEESFSFPILKSGLQKLRVKRQIEKGNNPEEARVSLEVFGSHMTSKGDIALNLERKLSVLTWDAIPKAQSLTTTSRSSRITCDDIDSDASSDLFEIENISGTGSGQQSLFTRQASDGLSSCTSPTTLYAPSEASIEWSVVTASAADFSTVSDCDEGKPIEGRNLRIGTSTMNKKTISMTMMGKEMQKSHSSGLLGCKSHKAVKIVETVYKPNNQKANPDPEWHQRLNSSTHVGRLQAENKVKVDEFSQSQRSIASRPPLVSSSHSAHPSLSLYMP